LVLLVFSGLVPVNFCLAQGQATIPAKRTVLQQADVASAPAQETIFGKVEISPGSGNPFHTHYGTEMGYVLAGHIRLEIKGQVPRELGPGDSFLVPRGAVHRSVLIGNDPVTLINTWTVDKDKALLTPAP
jgi:quercetin dioxygenase-like cupin family protein